MNVPLFTTIDAFQSILNGFGAQDRSVTQKATAHNLQLTKPPGALGKLEDLAIWYAAWRGEVTPVISDPQVIIFAGNHGVAAQGVSAFPAEVTAQMVMNFKAGGAAINQLSTCFGATMDVHPLDLAIPTHDFTTGAAMSIDEYITALTVGWTSVREKADVLIVGEMGIGNTTSAAAVAYALFGGKPLDWVGRGTGVSDDGVTLKALVIEKAVVVNPTAKTDPHEALRCLGGRELVAIAGAIARARHLSIPVILDGFICCAAAACLDVARKGSLDHCVAGHLSAEGAHAQLLKNINKEPILSLGMRLGEGSGAALALGVLKGAVACHSGMATFAQAGVTAK